MMNLIGNAFKFTFNGHIKIIAGLIKVEDEDAISIAIEDTGLGIKDEDKPKLFKLFSMIDTTEEVNTTGTGFGLY